MAKSAGSKPFSLVVAILLAFSMIGLSPAPAAHAEGTAYFVDASAGLDTNSGQSASEAWKTLDKVNGTTFKPGDSILFKAGESWTGELHPLGSGTADQPISIGMFGTGAKPTIQGAGGIRAVYLYNQEYWDIGNLEVTNRGETAATAPRRGVDISAEDYQVGSVSDIVNVSALHGIRLHDLYVHDVNGPDEYNSAGIHVTVSVDDNKPAHRATIFDGLLIENNVIDNVMRSGIYTNSVWYSRPQMGGVQEPNLPWTPLKNVVIRGNKLTNVGGDGISPHNTDGALVEWNTVNGFQMSSAGYNAGIWTYNGDHTLYQYNEVSGGKTTRDGMAFDFDHSSRGNIYQYNYSHDNEGGTLLLCGDANLPDGGVYDGIFRYNISENDHDQTFSVCEGNNVYNTQIYNNVFYVGPGQDTKLLTAEGGSKVHAKFSNNIFYNLGTGGYAGKRSFTYDHNLFFGNNLPTTSTIPDPYLLKADPLFLNPGSGSRLGRLEGYKLLAGSPALGTGGAIGNNRDFWGSDINRGAYLGAGLADLAKGLKYSLKSKKAGPDWVQLDLGGAAALEGVKVCHYYADARTYHDVIIQLSNDPAFKTGVTTVFNNDRDNSSKQGAGTDAEYRESAAGKVVSFPAVNARYVRLWSNGNTKNKSNHDTEIAVYGNIAPVYEPMPLPDAHGFPDVLFAEIKDGNVPVTKAAITVDGNLDDWKDIDPYLMDVDREGNELKFKHSVSFAWDGVGKLFIKGTLNVPDNWLAKNSADTAEWWTDDVFEVFTMPHQPVDEAENRANALHYGFNSNNLFTSEGMATNATVKDLPVTSGKWSFEMEIPLTEEYVKELTANKAIYAKIGVELNSAGEISLLGLTSGGFWAPDNYLKLNFTP